MPRNRALAPRRTAIARHAKCWGIRVKSFRNICRALLQSSVGIARISRHLPRHLCARGTAADSTNEYLKRHRDETRERYAPWHFDLDWSKFRAVGGGDNAGQAERRTYGRRRRRSLFPHSAPTAAMCSMSPIRRHCPTNALRNPIRLNLEIQGRILGGMDAIKILLRRAADKRDNAIKAARTRNTAPQPAYSPSLTRALAREHRRGSPARADQSNLDLIAEIMPKDRVFTIADVLGRF